MDDAIKRYESFLSSWGSVFRKIPSILNLLSSYPELCSKINFLKPLNLDHLHEIQFEWISLISRFENPIERRFFKEYHVPVEKDSYDFFIDMSSKSLPVFRIDYFAFEPQHWYKTIVFSNINELIKSMDNDSFDLNTHFKIFWLKNRELVNKKVEQRELMGSLGNKTILPIKKNDLFNKGIESKHLFN